MVEGMTRLEIIDERLDGHARPGKHRRAPEAVGGAGDEGGGKVLRDGGSLCDEGKLAVAADGDQQPRQSP
jgi:hypothetical protein